MAQENEFELDLESKSFKSRAYALISFYLKENKYRSFDSIPTIEERCEFEDKVFAVVNSFTQEEIDTGKFDKNTGRPIIKTKPFFRNNMDPKWLSIIQDIVVEPDFYESFPESEENETFFDESLKTLCDNQGWSFEDTLTVKHFFTNLKRRLLGLAIKEGQLFVLQSINKGSGKSEFFNALDKALKSFGADGVRTIYCSNLTQTFQDWKKWNGVLFFDEKPYMDSAQTEVLKSEITWNGSTTLQVKFKNNPISIQPRYCFAMTCNRDARDVFYGEAGERRLGLIEFDKYKKECTNEELVETLIHLLISCPREYTYDPKLLSVRSAKVTSEETTVEVLEILNEVAKVNPDVLFKERSKKMWIKYVLGAAKENGIPVLPESKVAQFIDQDNSKYFRVRKNGGCTCVTANEKEFDFIRIM